MSLRDKLNKIFMDYDLPGERISIGGTTVNVLLRDNQGKVMWATGTSVPSAKSGFAKGCLFVKTDATTGTKGLYENQGLTSSCSFNLIGAISEGEISVADGKFLIGNASGVGAAKTLSGDITSTREGVVTIGAKKVLNTMIAAAAGTVLVGTKTSGDVTALDISAAGAIPIGQGAGETAAAHALSGDVTMAATGATTIGAKKVLNTMIAAAAGTALVGTKTSGDVTALDISAEGAFAMGQGAGETPAAAAMSGDITMAKTGVTTIGAKKVLNTMIAAAAGTILVGTKTSGDVTALDISAEGAIPIGQGAGETAAAAALSGDVTMAKTGATTIGAKKVLNTMIAAAAGTILVGTKTSGDVTALDISAEGAIPIGQGAGETAAAAALSGDVTMAKTGAVTIGAKKVVNTMIAAAAGTILVGTKTSGDVTALDASAEGALAIGQGAGETIAAAILSGDVTMAKTGAVTVAAGAITRAKMSDAAARKSVCRGIPTIAVTGNTDAYFIVGEAGTLDSVDFSGLEALAASDTNYITFTLTNLGQAGAGSTVMLAATDANTTKATGGSALVANAKRSLTVTGTGADLVVAAGDRLLLRFAATGTLANTVTMGAVAMRFAGTT